ncbi:MAG: PIN domain-containing protein [Actinomycetia bacterium]|nr:PIN domain-containing protein [Actinomycetes bacterium]
MAFGATYDACVLYPAGLRDLLVRLARTGLFRARWTDEILNEMVRSILDDRPDLEVAQLERTRTLMCEAVADCLTTGYESLIDGLDLPDPNDRHVLAAAIRAGSGVIVTENVKDFPSAALEPYNVEAQTPDVFVLHLIELSPSTVRSVIQSQAAALKDPPMTVGEVLDHLARSGLPRSAAALRHE